VGRHANPVPTIPLHVQLPADAHKMMSDALFSDVEGRVPLGSYQSFLANLIRRYFAEARLDVGDIPGEHIVKGPRETMIFLADKLGFKHDSVL
jgi:hypothetical protein